MHLKTFKININLTKGWPDSSFRVKYFLFFIKICFNKLGMVFHLYIVVSLENVSSHPDNYALAYLLWAHSDNVGQFLYDKIDAFYAWFFYSTYLLFHYSLKGHIRREETDSDTWRANVIQNFSYSNNILCFPWCIQRFTNKYYYTSWLNIIVR